MNARKHLARFLALTTVLGISTVVLAGSSANHSVTVTASAIN